MSVIYNFSELPENELQQFAANLVEKINSESIFSSEVDFKIDNVEADEMSGDLVISVSHDDYIEVPRAATWQCGDEDEVNSPEDPEYTDSLFDGVKKALKTLSAEIDSYKVTVEVDDVDDEETVDVEVDSYSHEDAGIGHYEYWGHTGYDSHPYIEAEGTIVRGCSCYLSFYVEPIK